LFVRRQGGPFVSTPKQEDFIALKELAEAGKLTPVIDKTFSLGETAAAIAHVGAGHSQGKTVITV
jgi:NADPH:quinone reductase-like Zn-dependent oxidoreductase